MAWFAGPVLLKIVFPLDILNYLLHLGGHTIFGLSGNHALAYFGATFTQLAFPVGAIYHFLKRRELLSADAVLFWLGESLLGCLLVALALTGAWLHYRFRPALPSRTPPT